MSSTPIKIHFFGQREGEPVFPLAASATAGATDSTVGADVHRYDRLFEEGPKRWTAVEPGEAELFVYCYTYVDNEATRAGAKLAEQHGKPCLFFHMVDETAPVDPPYGVVYRHSLLASQQGEREFVAPAPADDLLRETGGFQARPHRETPTVGFCGYVGTAWLRLLYQLQGRRRKTLGLRLRRQALAALKRSPAVETNFVERTQFWGGAISRFRGPDADAKRRVRQEFLDNLAGSDYTLCMRGAGNFSYRLYETLSMGRVPLFVNTDCRLPFDDEIDWRRHVAWVEQEDLPRIGERLAEFHAGLSGEQFEQLQRDNRQMWEDYLRPTEADQRVIDRVLA